MSKLGQRMLHSVEQAIAFANGEENGCVPHTFPDVKAIRTNLGLTQPAFAARFGLPVGSVRDWEQGRVVPDGAARVLLRVIERNPKAVEDALAR